MFHFQFVFWISSDLDHAFERMTWWVLATVLTGELWRGWAIGWNPDKLEQMGGVVTTGKYPASNRLNKQTNKQTNEWQTNNEEGNRTNCTFYVEFWVEISFNILTKTVSVYEILASNTESDKNVFEVVCLKPSLALCPHSLKRVGIHFGTLFKTLKLHCWKITFFLWHILSYGSYLSPTPPNFIGTKGRD